MRQLLIKPKPERFRSAPRVMVFAVLFITTLMAGNIVAQPGTKTFSFGETNSGRGDLRVEANTVYSKQAGFGFEPGAAVHCVTNAAGASSCIGEKPFYFSVAVPEGNYRVTATLGSQTYVKAELRRLMLEPVNTSTPEFVTRSFNVNVRTPQISTGGEVKLKDRERTSEQWAWDEKLTIEFNGTLPSVRSITIEPANVPTIFLLGDSTVCDQPGEPYASWGQMITRFFGKGVAIANHAESGESLKSSLGARRLDKVLSLMKRRDYLLIQYGHNDEKERGEGVGAFTTYKASLRQFIAEAKKKGGIPILITPMHRRTFGGDGLITNSHGDYPEAVRQAAREENVALIDLHSMSQHLYEALGKDGSGRLFKEGDGTHHNNYGAYELAKCIVQSIRDQKISLTNYLINGLSRFDPKRPDPFESIMIPASPAVTNLKPLGN